MQLDRPPPARYRPEVIALDVVKQSARPVLEFGRGWMMAPETRARSEELGLTSPFGFWANGRAGALGDVGPDVAAAAIGFMDPEQVHREWATRPAGLAPYDVAIAYAECAAAWGRGVLTEVPEQDLAELDALTAAVIDAALPSTGAIFAAWRHLPLPDDLLGRVTVRLNVVRELRGGAHLSAVHAAGLGPLGSILSTDDPVRGGPTWAATFGWVEPYPAPDHDARRQAEELTDAICVPAYAGLSSDEGARFVDLVTAVRAVF